MRFGFEHLEVFIDARVWPPRVKVVDNRRWDVVMTLTWEEARRGLPAKLLAAAHHAAGSGLHSNRLRSDAR